VRENIFDRLRDSEYFLFVDFKREQLSRGPEHRGSLFCNQELVLASYLGLPVVAFVEAAIKPRDGLIGTIQANPKTFTDRAELPSLVREAVVAAGWDANWRNQLTVSSAGQPVIAVRRPEGRRAAYYHLQVTNQHRERPATFCRGYLTEVVNETTEAVILPCPVGTKWQGFVLPDALILPRSSHRLDLFHVDHDDPSRMRFNLFADYGGFVPEVQSGHVYRLACQVVSPDFPPAQASVRVEFRGQYNSLEVLDVET
jgi:hypothetical protein